MKTEKSNSVFCPELNREVQKIDCYETWQGIENVLDEYYNYKTAMEICDKCEIRKTIIY